jgi:hypothetical protein
VDAQVVTSVATPKASVRKASRTKSASARTPDPHAAQRSVVRVYLALARRFAMGLPPCDKPASLLQPTTKISRAVQSWLENMDERVAVHQLRQLLQSTELSTEENLRALVQYYLRKPAKSVATRDKVDFLLVQYLFCVAPELTQGKETSLADVARILKPVLGEVSTASNAWLQPLDQLLATIETCPSLGCLIDKKCLEQGRQLKDSSKEKYFQPAVLVGFAHFNFVLRRAFFQMVRAEVLAVGEALDELQLRGISSLDCRAAKLSEKESVAQLHQLCAEWQQPFRAPYSAGRPFEQFVALHACVKEALKQDSRVIAPEEPCASAAPMAVSVAKDDVIAPVEPQVAAEIEAPIPQAAEESEPSEEECAPVAQQLAKPEEMEQVAPAADNSPEPTSKDFSAPAILSELDSCMKKIAQQLNAAGGAAERAASSVLYNGARLLLHSWEGEAFRRNGEETPDALRRAVASRAILAAAVEGFGHSGDPVDLDLALSLAERHVAMLQESAARARNKQQIEDAVNLSASSKRLFASVEKAKKLRTKGA